jgi:hypothetical protein
MGRTFTPEQKAKACEEILAKVRGGMSLRAVCESGDDLTPTESSFRDWCEDDEELAAQYTRAREDRAEKIFEECLAIADSQEGDVIKVDGTDQPNHDLIQRARLRIDTRKWMLGKMQPKVYGEKLDLNHGGNLTINISRDDADL